MGKPPTIHSFAGKARSFRLAHASSRNESYEIRRGDDGKLDEVVANPDYVHLEQMDDGFWWLGVMTSQGDFIHVYLTSKRRIEANVIEERASRRGKETGPARASTKVARGKSDD